MTVVFLGEDELGKCGADRKLKFSTLLEAAICAMRLDEKPMAAEHVLFLMASGDESGVCRVAAVEPEKLIATLVASPGIDGATIEWIREQPEDESLRRVVYWDVGRTLVCGRFCMGPSVEVNASGGEA